MKAKASSFYSEPLKIKKNEITRILTVNALGLSIVMSSTNNCTRLNARLRKLIRELRTK
jgi:hypothetical protein